MAARTSSTSTGRSPTSPGVRGSARLKARRTLLELRLARRAGMRIVWTAHDLFRHDRAEDPAERRFMRALFDLADAVIVHCASAADGLLMALGIGPWAAQRRARGARQVRVIPHGHYRGAYPDTISRTEARERLGLPAAARVVAFAGWVRPYKGVTELVRGLRGAAGAVRTPRHRRAGRRGRLRGSPADAGRGRPAGAPRPRLRAGRGAAGLPAGGRRRGLPVPGDLHLRLGAAGDVLRAGRHRASPRLRAGDAGRGRRHPLRRRRPAGPRGRTAGRDDCRPGGHGPPQRRAPGPFRLEPGRRGNAGGLP